MQVYVGSPGNESFDRLLKASMSPWLVTFAKVLPHLETIIRAAEPIFPSRRTQDQQKAPEIVGQQIAELQNASVQNAEAIKLLAEQMQKTLTALEQGASETERRIKRARLLSIVAVAFAALALGIAALAIGRP